MSWLYDDVDRTVMALETIAESQRAITAAIEAQTKMQADIRDALRDIERAQRQVSLVDVVHAIREIGVR